MGRPYEDMRADMQAAWSESAKELHTQALAYYGSVLAPRQCPLDQGHPTGRSQAPRGGSRSGKVNR
jgi:hypothetical protein